ncbi:hypothetical protein [Carboxylicivirga marina]|uniref:hypothetical protein n=1 Tax=Carboxylicivirga marina TaxID=2800988 RepID=UPI00259907AF|nr:hypothetical protein [uncultured Carboxylicivirga sp.]
MKKVLYTFLGLAIVSVLLLSCDFDEDLSGGMVPENPNAPGTPSGLVVKSACGQIELTWDSIYLASTYEVYVAGELVAEGLTEQSYIYVPEADNFDLVELTVKARNANGVSEVGTVGSGMQFGPPPAPVNFEATDGQYKAAVLSWEMTEEADFFRIYRGDELIADNVITMVYFDNDNAPSVSTEYKVVAVRECGESTPATTMGHGNASLVFVEDFAFSAENNLLADLGFSTNFGWLDTHTGEASVMVKVGGNDKYGFIRQTGAGLGAALIFPSIDLTVGKRYQISFDVKCGVGVNMYIRNSSGNRYLEYLLPSDEHTGGNNNNQGKGVPGIAAETGEWYTYTQDFPYVTSKAPLDQTGDGTNPNGKKPNNIKDTGRTDRTLWSASTITEEQKSPYIEVSIYNAEASNGWGIDNIRIEEISE